MIQQDDAVLPSSRSSAKLLSSWPFSPAKCHFDRRDPPARSRCSLCHLFRFRMVRLLVAPAHLQQGFRALPAFGAVQFAQAMVNPGKDFAIIARFTGHPDLSSATAASGRSWRSNLFGKAGRRQTEDFGLNRRRVDIIRLAVVLPEGRGFGHQRVDNHHIFQLAEAANHFVLSGKEATGLKPGRYSR